MSKEIVSIMAKNLHQRATQIFLDLKSQTGGSNELAGKRLEKELQTHPNDPNTIGSLWSYATCRALSEMLIKMQ